jgi:hypothetical protein
MLFCSAAVMALDAAKKGKTMPLKLRLFAVGRRARLGPPRPPRTGSRKSSLIRHGRTMHLEVSGFAFIAKKKLDNSIPFAMRNKYRTNLYSSCRSAWTVRIQFRLNAECSMALHWLSIKVSGSIRALNL